MAMIRLRTRLAKRNCYAFDILDEGGEANLRRGRGTRRSFTPLGASLVNFDRRPSHSCRSGAAGPFYLVLFAPASSEQAFCSLGCEFSQVLIDCVSEADIFLFMQLQ